MKELISATLKMYFSKNVWLVLTNFVLTLSVASVRLTHQAYVKQQMLACLRVIVFKDRPTDRTETKEWFINNNSYFILHRVKGRRCWIPEKLNIYVKSNHLLF